MAGVVFILGAGAETGKRCGVYVIYRLR